MKSHDSVVVVGPASWNTLVRLSELRHLNLMADGERLSIYLSLPQTPVDAPPSPTLQAIEAADHVVLDLSLRTRDVLEIARESDATVWTDLHNCDGELAFHRPFLDAADIVFLSNEALGDPRPFMARSLSAGKRLMVCTLGPDGAIALDRRGWHRVAAIPTEVIDTNGAGDAFLAGFLAATRDGAEVHGALESGAGQAVRALGTRHLSPRHDSR